MTEGIAGNNADRVHVETAIGEPPRSVARIIAVCSAIGVAGSTLLPWYSFPGKSLTIYGGNLQQYGGYMISFAGSPGLGACIVVTSAICAVMALNRKRWGAVLLAAIPFLIYQAIKQKLQYPNDPWEIGFGAYCCGVAAIIAFVATIVRWDRGAKDADRFEHSAEGNGSPTLRP